MPRPTGRTTPSTWRRCSPPSRCSSLRSAALPPGPLRSSSRGAGDSDTRSAICTTAADKQPQQLVEKEPAALGRGEALPVSLDETLLFGFVDLCLHHRHRQPGPFLEERER